jgi:hypothetical protein
MSGGGVIGGGMLGILLGVGLMGFGFWRVRTGLIYTGAGLVLTGVVMIEIGKRMPY